MMEICRVKIASAREMCLLSSLARVVLFGFHRDSSIFASANGMVVD